MLLLKKPSGNPGSVFTNAARFAEMAGNIPETLAAIERDKETFNTEIFYSI